TFWSSESGGTQLGSGFSDADTVTPDADGVYSTMIGDDPALLVPATVFSGNSVWLNVNVNGEDLAPRRRVASVAYALQSGNADTLDGAHKADLANASHTHDAIDIESGVFPPFLIPQNITLTSAAFIYGEAIRAGTIAQAYIDAAIARDSEILPTVLASDGPGSGLDADTLDGQQATDFALDSEIIPHILANDGAGSGIDADTLDGQQASAFAASSHTHGPYTFFYSIDRAAWQPNMSSTEYSSQGGNGGFCVTSSGFGKMIAPVNLPDGAIVDSFTVYFDKDPTHTEDVTVNFARYYPLDGNFSTWAEVDSSGISGVGAKTVAIPRRTVNNEATSLTCSAYSSDWGGGKVEVRGVIIEYTLNTAP
ncbi:MAG TPA: hypothetical protein PKI11_05170, partial [Candidatus Hydrogenedentes bacterium]|nr:hypothetical protein [Candidatus Hydrogenedentota bacterium]